LKVVKIGFLVVGKIRSLKMAYNTRIYTARKRAEEHQANLKAQKEREIDEVIATTVKRYSGNGTKRAGVVMLMESPGAQIEALDLYISDLRDINEEMTLRYGPGIERRLWLVNLEIDKAIEAIAKLKMEQIRPGD
jgi:hypothetical protein